jgi:hypothetical protein
VVYLMRTPQRRKELKAREAAEDALRQQALGPSSSPDAGSHAPGAAQTDSVAAVRKET